jgi:hypothetical protein
MSILSRLKELKEGLQRDEAKLNELSEKLERHRPQRQEQTKEQTLAPAQMNASGQQAIADFKAEVESRGISTGQSTARHAGENGHIVGSEYAPLPKAESGDQQQRIKDPAQKKDAPEYER